jgi:hypothetical protein
MRRDARPHMDAQPAASAPTADHEPAAIGVRHGIRDDVARDV